MSDEKDADKNAEKKPEEAEKQAEQAQREAAQTSWTPPHTRGGFQGAEEAESVPLWLITFTDIMALMLTFFVMIYTMSVPVEEKWEELTTAFDTGFSKFQSANWNTGPQDTISIDKLDMSRALNLDYLETVVREIIDSNESLANIVVIPQENRLILSLPSELLFEAGSAEVGVEGKRAIFALGAPLSRIRNRIEVVGHTDPRPIESKDSTFRSNWDLSLMRAANVAGVLENVGYARSITIKGLASGRYDELPAEVGEDERLGLSRRVDIVVMQDDGSQRFLSALGSSG